MYREARETPKRSKGRCAVHKRGRQLFPQGYRKQKQQPYPETDDKQPCKQDEGSERWRQARREETKAGPPPALTRGSRQRGSCRWPPSPSRQDEVDGACRRIVALVSSCPLLRGGCTPLPRGAAPFPTWRAVLRLCLAILCTFWSLCFESAAWRS